MKKIILIISAFIFINTTFSQEPVSPELLYVTVRQDSICEIFWDYPETTNINGFIIKRVILDGTGVVNGTLNNIAVIENNSLTSFLDTAFEYSTVANPYIRSEKYAVSTFLYRNDSVILSNMSLPQKTVFLKSEWDFCNQTANFNWTKYINNNVQSYKLFYGTTSDNLQLLEEFSPSDTSYSTQDLQKNIEYFFRIEAVLSNQQNNYISKSNLTNFYTGSTVVPDTLQNIYISTINENSIKILFYCSDGFGIDKFILQKENSNQVIDLAEFSGDTKFLSYLDQTDVNQINRYWLKVVDMCQVDAFTTDKFQNLILSVSDVNKTYSLNWNEISVYENQPEFYDIEVDISGNWQLLETVSGVKTSAEFSFENIFTSQYLSSEIKFVKFRLNAYYDTVTVLSNIVELPVTGVFAIPNAFNPISSDNENAFFTIKAEFINNFSMVIYSETGSILFKTQNITNRWNGRYANGQLVERGSYIYKIIYTDNSGNEQKLSGIINVVY